MEENYPPYTITDKILNYVSEIMKKIGEANYFKQISRIEKKNKNKVYSFFIGNRK